MRLAVLLIVVLAGCADADETFDSPCGPCGNLCEDFGLFDPEAVFSDKCSFGYVFCCAGRRSSILLLTGKGCHASPMRCGSIGCRDQSPPPRRSPGTPSPSAWKESGKGNARGAQLVGRLLRGVVAGRQRLERGPGSVEGYVVQLGVLGVQL
jgi:hypothetical protein